MSRLRWPDSTNSVSDVPGTIHNAKGCGRLIRLAADGGRWNHACFRALRSGVSLAKYGRAWTCASPLREGDVIQRRMTNPDAQVVAFRHDDFAPGTYGAAAAPLPYG